MELEKLVKSSFENFEPEVNPSVWDKLAQNLNNAPVSSDPSGASSLAAKTAIKTLVGNVSPWIWVAGVVSTAAIIAVIVSSSPEKIINTPVVQEKTINEAKGNEVVGSSDNLIENNPIDQSVTVVSGNNNETEAAAIPGVEAAEKANTATSAEVLTSEKEPALSGNNSTGNQHVSQTDQVNPEIKDNKDNVKAEAPSTNTVKPVVNIQPVIIINSQTGFAPFKITALLNNEALKGDWEFGDGHTVLAGNKVTHSFTKPGSYKLTCRIGETTIEKDIEVIGSVSTAFTPNGDGVNDEFYIESNQLQQLTVKIVDRSGKQVFEISEPGQRWNGKDSGGDELPTGTYYYNIFARSNSGDVNQKGTISIFR